MTNHFKHQTVFYFVFLFGIIGLTQCAGSIESQLKSTAEEANKQCPKMLDQWTRLDSCVVFADESYKSYHTISNIIISDTILFKSQLTPQILRTIKIHPDMRFFRDNDITLKYQYNDQSSEYLFTIIITPDEYKN